MKTTGEMRSRWRHTLVYCGDDVAVANENIVFLCDDLDELLAENSKLTARLEAAERLAEAARRFENMGENGTILIGDLLGAVSRYDHAKGTT